ncbi:MAG: fucose isomerase [Armatimonadota bacterium]|nr:fucose isomerase [Armatimonadota bacterium]
MTRGLQSITLGLVPISKFVFSREDALHYKGLIEQRLRELGVRFVSIDSITEDGTLFRHEDLPRVIEHLRREGVDAIFCPHCNFGTEDVAALLGREMSLPYLLWGPRDEEPLPDGTRLRDTQCGLFATSQILRRMDVPFTYIPNCRLDDAAFDRGVLGFLRVASVVRAFRGMHIGQIGQRNDFFWTVMVNEAELLERFGIEVYQIYLTDVLDEVERLAASPSAELKELVERMREEVTFEGLGDGRVRAVAALKLVLTALAEEHGLSAIAQQCFPGFQQRFGVYPCYANSLLTDEGVPVICETDVHGAITACILQAAALGESPPFFADLTIRHPGNDNAELLWHCGAFPASLAADDEDLRVGEHFIMPQDATGVCHWRIRGGDMTIARFSDDRGDYRLGFGEGRATDGPETVGTYTWMEVDDWPAWERRFIRGPYIHHVAGVHGHWATILHEACRYIPGLQPDPIGTDGRELEDYWWR